MMAESNENVTDLWLKCSQLRRKWRDHNQRNANGLAGQPRAIERETVEIAQHRNRSILGAKILPCQGLQLLAGDRFDGVQDFVQRIEPPEIQLLAREVGHASAGGFQ